MEKKEKRIIAVAVIGILLIISLTHFDLVLRFLSYVGNLILPIIIGLVIAFVLNVPVTGFEKLLGRIFKKRNRKTGNKAIHIVSIILTLICVALVLTVLGTLVIPELVRTIKSIAALVEEHWPSWLATLEKHNINTADIKEWISSLDFDGLIKKATENAGSVLGSIADITTSTVSIISSVVMGLVIAIYVLFSRERLGRQSKKVLYAYVKTGIADKVCHICTLIKTSYTKFLTGQCAEAIILGLLIFISFSIFRLPYAGLIGAVTSICALIPYIGAFISCGLGVVLALLVSPRKALMCLIVYLVVQFIETQFIYPRVVGSSVGLSPLWTLLAFLIGGRLFGLLGMIFFIPLVSVLYTLVKEDVDKRIRKKKKNEKLPDDIKGNCTEEGDSYENQ